MPAYDKLQQVFCLNQIANSASDTLGTQEELQKLATRRIRAVLADQRIAT